MNQFLRMCSLPGSLKSRIQAIGRTVKTKNVRLRDRIDFPLYGRDDFVAIMENCDKVELMDSFDFRYRYLIRAQSEHLDMVLSSSVNLDGEHLHVELDLFDKLLVESVAPRRNRD